jgi:SAM-dependent methyltransferase
MQRIRKLIGAIKSYGARYTINRAIFRRFPRAMPGLANFVTRVEGLRGLEIGGPSPVFGRDGSLPIYDRVNVLDNCNFAFQTVWEGRIDVGRTFKFSDSRPIGKQFVVEAAHLATVPELATAPYDFLLSSHMLEHSANPIKVLLSWHEVVKENGSLVLVLPDKRLTFDHRRPVTSMDHLIGDFERDVQESDLTHLPEILALHDPARDDAHRGVESFERQSRENFENRCLHHHVFDEDLVRMLLEFSGWSVLLVEFAMPHHIVALASSRLRAKTS